LSTRFIQGTPVNYQGRTDGALAPAGSIGETPGTLRSGTGGFTYSTRSTTSATASDSTLASISLNKGVYLISMNSFCSQNDALIRRYYIYPTVGGTSVANSANTNLAQNTIGGVTMSFPLIITSDATTVVLVGAVASLSGSTASNNHEIFAVRIA